MEERKRYTKEFKQEAVRLVESGDKQAAELARELGVAIISYTNGRNNCRRKVLLPFPVMEAGRARRRMRFPVSDGS